MRREFARLIADSPKAFAECVDEYNRCGAEFFPPEQKTGGRPIETPDISLALLLADYRYAQDCGITQRQFLADKASRGINTGDKFRGRVWHDESAIEAALNKALRRARDNPEFQEQVEFYRSAIASIGGVDSD